MTLACARAIHRRLRGIFGAAFTNEASIAIRGAFESLSDEVYEDVIECYLRNPATRGNPPTPATLQTELAAYLSSKAAYESAAAAHQRVTDWEAEKHHRALMRAEQIQGALRVSAEVKRRLVAKYHLDCRAPVDQAVVMGALTDAMCLAESRGVLYLSVEDTLPLAEKYAAKRDMAERDRWLRACSSVQ